MSSIPYDMAVEQGSTFNLAVVYSDGEGIPINLTGYTARMQVRTDPDTPVLVELTTANGRIVLDGPTGQLLLTLPDEVTALFGWTAGLYDLEIVSPLGEVQKLLHGRFMVTAEITQ